VYEAFKL